jgi:hypothetical protein
MLNWYSLPAFVAMLIFWALAIYGVTRGPPRAVALVTAAAQVTAAAFLLGQGMEANAVTIEDWRPWARNFDWGATIAPALWYWVTLLALREQPNTKLLRYLRWFGYPGGVLLGVASLALTIMSVTGDDLQVWSSPVPVSPEIDPVFRFHVAVGPFYPALVALVAGATLGAAVNLWLGASQMTDPARRRHFRWLMASAISSSRRKL